MQSVTLQLGLFERSPEGFTTERERKHGRKILLFLMEGLSYANSLFLEDNPTTPSVYVRNAQGTFLLRYIPEEFTEEWLRIPFIFKAGGGDCEDLACARVAELRRQGIQAQPRISWRQRKDGSWLYHARCWRATATSNLPPVRKINGFDTIVPAPSDVGGYIEDPARVLGM